MAHPLTPTISKIESMLEITKTLSKEDFSEEELKVMQNIIWDLAGVKIKLENRRAETMRFYI